jgi:acetylornithine deacetylase/succinyl-diaminopimelate desuccinylase-like protein
MQKKISAQDSQLIELLRDLIKIPSWVSDDSTLKKVHNENKVVGYLEKWLKDNVDMEVIRQPLAGGRFNLIVKKGRPDLIFLAHTDTVQPSENAPYNQLAAEIHDDKIWGRGATDMKSGIAAMVHALSLSSRKDNIWMFLYADEEYDFLGMKAIVEEYGHLRPKLIVSSDGSDLQIGHGCRGLIEIRAQFLGETGHPAKQTGKSAIWQGLQVLSKLEEYLKGTEHEVMGPSSFNVAYVFGGAQKPDSFDSNKSLTHVGQAGNIVPDIMEFVLDIRPSQPDISADAVTTFLKDESIKRNLGFRVLERKHSLGAWYTPASKLTKFEKLAKKLNNKDDSVFSNPKSSGYLDLQMFWQATGNPTSLIFGGGQGITAHTPQEHILIEDLIKERDFFLSVLESQ